MLSPEPYVPGGFNLKWRAGDPHIVACADSLAGVGRELTRKDRQDYSIVQAINYLVDPKKVGECLPHEVSNMIQAIVKRPPSKVDCSFRPT